MGKRTAKCISHVLNAALIFFVLGAFVLVPAGCTRPKAQPLRIQVTMHRYAIEPEVIHVKKGQDVTLDVSTTDVQHGFAVKELGIDEPIQPGRPAEVSVKTDKPGEFKVECSIICGPGHQRMQGKIVVE